MLGVVVPDLLVLGLTEFVGLVVDDFVTFVLADPVVEAVVERDCLTVDVLDFERMGDELEEGETLADRLIGGVIVSFEKDVGAAEDVVLFDGFAEAVVVAVTFRLFDTVGLGVPEGVPFTDAELLTVVVDDLLPRGVAEPVTEDVALRLGRELRDGVTVPFGVIVTTGLADAEREGGTDFELLGDPVADRVIELDELLDGDELELRLGLVDLDASGEDDVLFVTRGEKEGVVVVVGDLDFAAVSVAETVDEADFVPVGVLEVGAEAVPDLEPDGEEEEVLEEVVVLELIGEPVPVGVDLDVNDMNALAVLVRERAVVRVEDALL